MARPDQEKCRLCSKLSSQEAQQRYGADGIGCWNPSYCYNRRSYYRHRDLRNQLRKQQRRGQQGARSEETQAQQMIMLELPAPAVPAAVIQFYRETKSSPIHALGAELWVGNDRVAQIAPVHCLGLTEQQVKTLLMQILELFSQHQGTKIERFRAAVELHPNNCPIRPCPQYPESTYIRTLYK